MDLSVFLARVIGLLFILIGFGVFLNPKHYAAMTQSFLKDPQLYYFSGALAFIAGVTLVQFHNLWVADWRVVLTVIAWVSVVKGVGRIVFPRAGSGVAASIVRSELSLRFSAVLLLLIGGWMAYEGFR